MSEKSDRVVLGLGRKLSDGNYGSWDFHFSYSSDVEKDETLDQAVERVSDMVMKNLKNQMKKVKAKKDDFQ